MTREPTPESLMAHSVPRKSRARLRWPTKTTPPRCAGCNKQPPARICPKEES